jgi:predicted lipoprotein with Yx(FWY)xxD motif
MKRLALALLVVFAFVACSDDQTPTVTETTPGTTQTTPSPSPTDTAVAGTIKVASSSLGNIVVDAQARTLYLFMRDSATTSECTGACTGTWPPLTITGSATAGAGIDASKLGTISRPDGSTQVTYNCHPLYRYAADSAPGDTKGQGVGGNWFVVTPAGEAMRT